GLIAGQRPVRSVGTNEFSKYAIESETEAIQSLAQDPVRQLCFLERVRPGVYECTDCLEASLICDRHLELVGGRSSLDSGYAYTILAVRRQFDGGKVGDHVGCDVGSRITHLVDELLGDGLNGHPAAGSRVLRHDERPIRTSFDHRVTNICQIRNRLPVVETIP